MDTTDIKDWKLQIKEKLDDQDARRLEIQEAIVEKISYLKQYLGNRKVEFEASKDYSLNWKIIIGNTSFIIDDSDITEGQKLYSEGKSHYLLAEKRDIKTVVEEIIVAEFLKQNR